MKKIRKLFAALMALLLILSLTACAGAAPYIGENGNWFIDGEDTGVSAKGESGESGEIGGGFEVSSFEKISDVLGVATYKIVFSSGLEKTFEVTTGIAPSITACEPIPEKSTEEKTVYKISFSTGYSAEFEVENGDDGKDGTLELSDIKNYEILKTQTLGSKVLSLSADRLESAKYLRPVKLVDDGNGGTKEEPVVNAVINNKHLSVYMELESLGENGVIKLGHGETEYGATYIEITKTEVKFYSKGKDLSNYKTDTHKLDIKDWLKVNIDVDYGSAKISIMTNDSKGIYETRGNWSGRNGAVFVKPVGVSLDNVKLNWFSDDLDNDIYMIGDSYFSATDASRWTRYLITNGYTNNCLISFSGMGTPRGLYEFKHALEYGTPKYAFWCMGMNNGDKNGTINPDYLAATEEFLAICEERGIIPILSTIPSTSKDGASIYINNNYKNEWVRDWAYETGGRYVDFDAAVVKDTSTGAWYDGMLYSDSVHPDVRGAQALYMQAVVDFPELMIK